MKSTPMRLTDRPRRGGLKQVGGVIRHRRHRVVSPWNSVSMIGGETSMSTNDREFRDWLNNLRKDLRRIKKDLAKNEWAVEDLTIRVEERAQMVKKSKKSASRSSGRASRAGSTRRSNVRYVKEGVASVVIEHDADGWMLAHVENIGLPVLLKSSQRLRELLLALCGKVSRVNGREPGQVVVPFKSANELIEAIKELSGKKISVSNLQNLVQHLRDLLNEARINRDLVETGGGGYRFRLRMDGRIHEEVN